MIRRTVVSSAVAAGLLAAPYAGLPGSAAAAIQAPRQLTPAEAAPFLGEWTLDLQGPDGPGAFGLSLETDKEQVVGEITTATMPKQAITDMSLDKGAIVLGYSFTWEGNPVDAVVTLTPAGDGGKVAARIDFAGGAYVMSGTATKKEGPG